MMTRSSYIVALLLSATAANCTADVESEPGENDIVPEPGDGSGTVGTPSEFGAPPTNKVERVVNVTWEAQSTGYWCGPTATKIALSASMAPPSQQALANQLGTTTNGTNHIGLVTDVLNRNLEAGWYTSHLMPNDPPTQAQRDQLWHDLVRSVDNGMPIVANIVAPASNHPPGYPNYTIYHYITVIGYNTDTRQAYVADPANFQGNNHYWLSFNQLATLIPPKGYSAAAECTRDAVVGKIAEKFDALGGCGSVIGAPITPERSAPDNVGRYSVFERGSIYWTPTTGAFEVHGKIRDAWAAQGWEAGPLGYPISDEKADGDGRRSDFQHGYIRWTAAGGAVIGH